MTLVNVLLATGFVVLGVAVILVVFALAEGADD